MVLPDKASLHLTAIEDAEYKEDKIECKFIGAWVVKPTNMSLITFKKLWFLQFLLGDLVMKFYLCFSLMVC